MIIREQMTLILKAVRNIQDLYVLNGRQSDLQRTAELWRGMANDLAATLNRLQTRWEAETGTRWE